MLGATVKCQNKDRKCDERGSVFHIQIFTNKHKNKSTKNKVSLAFQSFIIVPFPIKCTTCGFAPAPANSTAKSLAPTGHFFIRASGSRVNRRALSSQSKRIHRVRASEPSR